MALDEASSTVVSTIIVNVIVGAILLILFEFNRGKKEIYAPKLRMRKHRCPPPLPTGFFAWVSFVMNMKDDETLGYIGLDAFMCLRFIRFCFRVCGVSAVVGMLVLWPVYFTAQLHQDGVAGVNLYTMANVNKNGDRLYASAICCWIFAAVFIFLIEDGYKEFVALRQAFLLKDDPDVSHQKRYSVVVQNIPTAYRTSEKLTQLFDEMFPGKIHSAVVACTVIELEKCIERRQEILLNLELAIAHFKASDMKDRKLIKINTAKQEESMCCGDKTDAIEFYTSQLDAVNKEIETMRKSSTKPSPVSASQMYESDRPSNGLSLVAKGAVSSSQVNGEEEESEADAEALPLGTPTGTGFVTFTSRAACVSCYRVGMLSDVYPNLKVTPAGPSTEIIWANLPYTTKYQEGGKATTKTVFTAGMLFWGTVLAFIGAISNLEALEKYLPFIKDLDATTYSLLAGLLPVAVMGYFISLLPVIFAYGATHVEKALTASAVQTEVFHW
jgi:hypothetical protein